jgi:hypothetical protein
MLTPKHEAKSDKLSLDGIDGLTTEAIRKRELEFRKC